jgi:hypothetical protein
LAKNLERFNLAALYFLGKAYDEHPIPVTVQRAEILDVIAPMPGEDEARESEDRENASVEVAYTFYFLAQNDYLLPMTPLNAANRALKTASSGKRGSKSRKVAKATTNVPGHHVRRFLAPDPTVRHRRATRGDLLIATRSNQPMPEYRRPTISGSGPPKLKRARRSLNRRSQRPSSRRRKPNGNAHSNLEGAQSLASRFWATQIAALQLARAS